MDASTLYALANQIIYMQREYSPEPTWENWNECFNLDNYEQFQILGWGDAIMQIT
jgi:hypothetical protein